MSDSTPSVKYLHDYREHDYRIDEISLVFDLHEDFVTVRATSRVSQNGQPAGTGLRPPLVLDGQELVLKSLSIDGLAVAEDKYRQNDEQMIIEDPPAEFTLEIVTEIYPHKNTSLEGLYKSSQLYCTQCEAEGFRKITYFIDRPDNMATYECTLHAEKARYPVLLSNGDLVASGESPDGRHWATWRDPFRKPSYLFALVAGDLRHLEDHYTTLAGANIILRVYVEPSNIGKCEHAMHSLKKAMQWDEEKYGLEYDLGTYMVVAVNDFNMGAMENKGLNIFNSKYVLANPETATDDDYEGIESVIGHEYFHNWTGNRVTCRDWFQLSLKEGLTVFRDQEFSADVFSRPVKRIQDVRILRNSQFLEDAGPMAHPVRPDSYMEINNFYTATVYNKGAEVVRMYQVLFGEDGFRRGLQHYLQKFDGQAVTTDDFFDSMMQANHAQYEQFKLWYSQAGTPLIEVSSEYSEDTREYTITMRQSCPPTPGQEHKQPFLIPVTTALLDAEGNHMPLFSTDSQYVSKEGNELVLHLDTAEKSFVFRDIPQQPIPSLLRNFSAPVKLDYPYSDDELAFLFIKDTDSFNRWEAGQRLLTGRILSLVEREQSEIPALLEDDTLVVSSFSALLADHTIDRALVAEALLLPSESYLSDMMNPIRVDELHNVREALLLDCATRLRPLFLQTYLSNRDDGAYTYDADAAGRRKLKNVALSYLMYLTDDEAYEHSLNQFRQSSNMTDMMAAFAAIIDSSSPSRDEVTAQFYERWRTEPLVMDKWLSLQARCRLPGTLQRVKKLMSDPVFDMGNPNKVRALIGSFVMGNQSQFHHISGEGYEFLKQQIVALDRRNPQITARLMSAFTRWKRYDEVRQALMKSQLEEIVNTPQLSADCYEIATKSLGNSK